MKQHVMNNKKLITIMIVAAFLRLAFLGSAALWYDETFTAWVSSVPFGQTWAALLGDVHPPLYYLLTWLVVNTTGVFTPGGLALVLRALSVPFSLGAVYLTYIVGKALGWPERGNLAAAALMALSPMQIFFAQEARMYAMFQAVILLAFLGVIKRNWGVVALGLTLALWLHNYGLIYWGALGLVFIANYWHHSIVIPQEAKILPLFFKTYGPPIVAFVLPIVSWLPWVSVLAGQMETVAGGYWILPPTLGDIISVFYYTLGGIVIHESFHAVAVMVYLGAAILALYRMLQKRPMGWVPLVIFGFAPLSVAVVASYMWSPILLYRGLLPSSAAVFLLMGWALTRGPVRNQIIAAFLTIPVLIAALYPLYVSNPKNSNQAVRKTIENMRAEWQTGDIIYHIDAGSAVGFWLYARDLPQYLAPPCEDETMGSLSPATRQGLGIIEKPLSEIEHSRAWVVYALGPTARACMVRDYGYLAKGNAWELTEDSEYVFSGVWLHERSTSNKVKQKTNLKYPIAQCYLRWGNKEISTICRTIRTRK